MLLPNATGFVFRIKFQRDIMISVCLITAILKQTFCYIRRRRELNSVDFEFFYFKGVKM